MHTAISVGLFLDEVTAEVEAGFAFSLTQSLLHSVRDTETHRS